MSEARTSRSSSCRMARVKDFKLNTQCSAGNGYFLQSTAESFGISVESFADAAFLARRIPRSAMAAPFLCSRTSSTSSARAGGRRRSSPA